MENKEVIGIPTLAFLPAKNFKFNISEEVYELSVPLRGSYFDLDNDFFEDNGDEYDLYKDNVFNISLLTRVLLSAKQYPDLKEDQVFCPIVFVVDGDNLVIHGQVVTMLDGVENG